MSLEQGPKGPEKNLGEKIAEFKSSFEGWLKENSEIAQQLKKELLERAGVEESELVDPEAGFDMGLLKIPVGELPIFGTACGTRGNKPFSRKVVDFLQLKEVHFTVALGENEKPTIFSVAVNISGEDAEQFEEMITSGQGSLRGETSRVGGWSVFESE